MIVKGYNIDSKNKDRLLNEYICEYGINLNHKENIDIFKSCMKPKESHKNIERKKENL